MLCNCCDKHFINLSFVVIFNFYNSLTFVFIENIIQELLQSNFIYIFFIISCWNFTQHDITHNAMTDKIKITNLHSILYLLLNNGHD